MRTEAKVQFIDLEMGFWALVTSNGLQLKPVHFPEQLKIEGLAVEILYKEADVMDISMWGTPIHLTGFSTI